LYDKCAAGTTGSSEGKAKPTSAKLLPEIYEAKLKVESAKSTLGICAAFVVLLPAAMLTADLAITRNESDFGVSYPKFGRVEDTKAVM